MAVSLTQGPNALKISKAQQTTILEVLVASLIVGAAFVFAIWLVRYIIFNSRVISAKDEALRNYQSTVINIGVCEDGDGDGNLGNSEIEDCTPNEVKLSTIPNSLRYNIMVNMANNAALESVQRDLASNCYNDAGMPYNYLQMYENAAADSSDREYYLNLYQTCSALRAIPDALPGSLNTEAAMASLNYLFNTANVTPESMTPDGSTTVATVGTGTLMSTGINFSIEGSEREIHDTMETIEQSIRDYRFTMFNFSVNNNSESGEDELEFSATVETYYAESTGLSESTRTISGDDEGSNSIVTESTEVTGSEE